jgi:predicted aspartyl protease
MGRSSTAAERPTTVNISSWGTPEEGIYIDTMICSKPISMLVDTGASVIISLVLISLRKRMTFSPLVIIGISISIVISVLFYFLGQGR